MFLTVFTQVAVLFILIALGFILSKKGLLDDKGAKQMTDLVLLIVTPCVIINSFIREFNKALFKNLLICFLIAFLSHILFIVLGEIIFKDKDKKRNSVLKFGAVFSNCGFMSLPLQQAVLGDDGVFYGSAYIAMFNIFVWSYGLLTVSGDKKHLTPKKLLINPGIIGVTVGLLIFLFSIPVPTVIKSPVSFMAALNTPVPMIIIGYHLSRCDLLNAFKDKWVIINVATRIIVFPLLVLFIMLPLGLDKAVFVSSVISICAPTAANTTMFASKFGADTDLSVKLVSLSTVFSIITMPLVISLAQSLINTI